MDKPPNPLFIWARLMLAQGVPWTMLKPMTAAPLRLSPIRPAANDEGLPPAAA